MEAMTPIYGVKMTLYLDFVDFVSFETFSKVKDVFAKFSMTSWTLGSPLTSSDHLYQSNGAKGSLASCDQDSAVLKGALI